MTSIYFKENQNGDENQMKIIDLKESPTRSDVEIIEVEETPEVKLKLNTRNSISESIDSPINLPKKVNKRMFFDEDEDEDRKNKKQMISNYETNDEIGKSNFEDMCETSIKELIDLFPEIDVCEIQDALIESNWSVFNASIKLGNLSNINEEEVEDKNRKNVDNISAKNNIKNGHEKMKIFDYYRKNGTKNDEYSENVSIACSSNNNNIKSIKNNKNQFMKRTKDDMSGDKVLSSSAEDSDDEEYDKEDIVGSSSEGDTEDESKSFKTSKSLKTQVKISDLRSRVVCFLQESNSMELQTIPGVSGKKIDLILNLRPFTDWDDVLYKFKSHSSLSTDILNNCCETLKARETVERLMNSCEQISKDLTQTIDKLNTLEQPKLLNSQMKLSNYQLIGLNWLALMHKKGLNCILADEMGLGKTIQVIAFLAYLRETRNIAGPHLVIVPSSVLDNWSREVSIKLYVFIYKKYRLF